MIGARCAWATMVTLLALGGCAADGESRPADAGFAAEIGPSSEVVTIARPDGGHDLGMVGVRPLDEPPLVIPTCVDGESTDGSPCCASALGFEDGSTQHFLVPGCCRLALANPTLVSTPTGCGRGALRLDAFFLPVDATTRCGTPTKAPACDFQLGEVSRAVSTSLDLTGQTMSALLYLDGAPLPAAGAEARLFVLARGGLILGAAQPLVALGSWTPVTMTIRDDGTDAGADVFVIGLDVDVHGQPWTGRVYLDEITWR
jgi:hypothetical protein